MYKFNFSGKHSLCARAHVDLEKPYGTQREFFQKWYATAMSTTADCVHKMCVRTRRRDTLSFLPLSGREDFVSTRRVKLNPDKRRRRRSRLLRGSKAIYVIEYAR